MPENVPQQGWDPSRDRLARWPLIEHWAGLRREIKQAWLHLAEIAPAGSARYFVGVGDLADGFRVMDYTSIWRRLTTLARLGLIRWESAYQTYGMVQASRPSEPVQWAITIEMFDPLTVDRKPVGRAVRVPKIGSGDFDRQRNLFGDSEPRTLRMWTDDSDACEDPTDGEQPQAVAVVAVQPQAVVAKTPPERMARPPESVPQCPAPAGVIRRSNTKDLTSSSKEPLEGDGADSSTPPAKNERDDPDDPGDPGDDDDDEGFLGGQEEPEDLKPITDQEFEAHRDEIVQLANDSVKRAWKPDQRHSVYASDRSLILKACALASLRRSPYGPQWLESAVASTAGGRRERPGAYLHKLLRDAAEKLGRDNFNRDLKAVTIPEDLLRRDRRSRDSSAADRNVHPPPVEIARAEAREVVAAARAAIREANRAARAAGVSNPQSPIPNPSKENPCERF